MVIKSSAAEAIKTKNQNGYKLQTLTSWLLMHEQDGVIDSELTIVISSISMACKQIASLVQRAGISKLTGGQGVVNVQGEDQKKLDIVSNEVPNTFLSSGRTGIIASEEEDVPVAVEESYYGNYIVVFDPLDGSSNTDAAVSTGSIFGNDACLVDLEDTTTVLTGLPTYSLVPSIRELLKIAHIVCFIGDNMV
ncbi:PREDICTED: fructose-1,6-bisphosphatase, chloroplastic-like [Nicotiana attenuata]|uniref:fructose-1,6-bisphosphatase, chloroplastic-like n=1 Tax=Nicotiana attenuata TaxID=49451 RepID=UPI000904F93B|nr:PREDICTED: fructose-1,6-bisphosphatase, chloroplastic-like [Nicotiana attenuata]